MISALIKTNFTFLFVGRPKKILDSLLMYGENNGIQKIYISTFVDFNDQF